MHDGNFLGVIVVPTFVALTIGTIGELRTPPVHMENLYKTKTECGAENSLAFSKLPLPVKIRICTLCRK